MKSLVIVGAGGHGKVIADIAKKTGYEEIIFLDDDPNTQKCGNYLVKGTVGDAEKYSDYEFVVGIGNCELREKIQNELELKNFHIVSMIHPSSVIAEDVNILPGCVLVAGSVVNSGAVIGKGCIVNTCSSVGHDCKISDFVHVAAGAHVAGTVEIGKRTWVGAGSTIVNNVTVCEDVLIGAGGVVTKDITEHGTYVGVPVKKIKSTI